MKLACYLFVGLFLISNVSAYTFVDIYLDERGSALFLGGTDEFIDLPDGIIIRDGEIIGRTQTLTNKAGGTWSFSYLLEDVEINLILPAGARIISIDGGEISIKNNRIYVSSIGGTEVTYVIEEGRSSLIMWILGAAIILIIMGLSFYFLKRPDKRKKKNGVSVREILGKRENLILDKLKETGKIKSSQLRKICDIPKASFSRHTQELERKKLIRRSGEGKNKFLELR